MLRNYQLEGKLAGMREAAAGSRVNRYPREWRLGMDRSKGYAPQNETFSRENVKVSRIGRLLECLGELLV